MTTSNQENVDWSQGYGYGFWMSRHGYRGDGAFGQFCVVLPEQDAVVAITGGTEEMQAVLDHVWEHLLPGLGATALNEDAHADLSTRLANLRLPPCATGSVRAGSEDWNGVTFSIAAPSTDTAATTLSSVTVGSAGGRLDVTLTERDNALTFGVGVGEWVVSESCDAYDDVLPVAASGGWIDDDTLRFEAIFLETPHRIDIECSLSTGTARASWRGTPLDGGRLKNLHRPR